MGEPYPDEVFWGAHGQASGRGPVNPYWRPGWRLPACGLAHLVAFKRLAGRSRDVADLDELRAAHGQLPH